MLVELLRIDRTCQTSSCSRWLTRALSWSRNDRLKAIAPEAVQVRSAEGGPADTGGPARLELCEEHAPVGGAGQLVASRGPMAAFVHSHGPSPLHLHGRLHLLITGRSGARRSFERIHSNVFAVSCICPRHSKNE